MIQYESFDFAAMPRTGSTWIQHAIEKTSHSRIGGNTFSVHLPFSGQHRIRLATVRHPLDWLCSIHRALKGGVPASGSILHRIMLVSRDSGSIAEFVERISKDEPGIIGKAFAEYQATSFIRTEDLPWSLIGFLELFPGFSEGMRERVVRSGKINQSKPLNWVCPKPLRRQLMKAEEDYCDRYEFY